MSAPAPGFADPVHDSQACFRAVLDAMARPGTVQAVAAPAAPPPPLGRAAASVLLTLVDVETPLWLDEGAEAGAAWVAFHCGAPRAALERAAFALALTWPAPDSLEFDRLHAGSDEAPEGGATLILEVAALGAGAPFRLSGPGLAAPTPLRVDGLPPGFANIWAANRARFPRGVDLILCSGDRLLALPRTVQVQEG